jgi:hypothetical protein
MSDIWGSKGLECDFRNCDREGAGTTW